MSPMRFPGSFPLAEILLHRGERAPFLCAPPTPNDGGDGRQLLCLFCKPLKPTALSALRAPLAFALSKP